MASNTCSPRVQELHDRVSSLAIAYTLPSCSRVLTLVEDFAEEASASSSPSSARFSPTTPTTPENEELATICRRYKTLYRAFVRDLVKKSADKEREIYDRAKATSSKRKRGSDSESESGSTTDDDNYDEDDVKERKSRQKRRGRVFAVDKGEHIVTALETLRLEEFLQEQAQEQQRSRDCVRRVRFLE